MQVKLGLKVLSASALVLALSGCGGGGGESSAPSSFAPPTTGTPSPPASTPTPGPSGITPLFAQGTGEDFVYVCDFFERGQDRALNSPQTGGVLTLEEVSETFTLRFDDLSLQFGPGDIFVPLPGDEIIGLEYQTFTPTRDRRFTLRIAPQSMTGLIGQSEGGPLRDIERLRLIERSAGVNVGVFSQTERELLCKYGLSFRSSQLPLGDQVSFNNASIEANGDRGIAWTASFNPANSELSFSAVTASQQLISGGTGSTVFMNPSRITTFITGAFSGRATVDAETGEFEGTLELDDFENDDGSFAGSEFTLEVGEFAGTFLGETGDQFALAFNIRASRGTAEDGGRFDLGGVAVATSAGDQGP